MAFYGRRHKKKRSARAKLRGKGIAVPDMPPIQTEEKLMTLRGKMAAISAEASPEKFEAEIKFIVSEELDEYQKIKDIKKIFETTKGQHGTFVKECKEIATKIRTEMQMFGKKRGSIRDAVNGFLSKCGSMLHAEQFMKDLEAARTTHRKLVNELLKFKNLPYATYEKAREELHAELNVIYDHIEKFMKAIDEQKAQADEKAKNLETIQTQLNAMKFVNEEVIEELKELNTKFIAPAFKDIEDIKKDIPEEQRGLTKLKQDVGVIQTAFLDELEELEKA